jgi:hypothetical protein
VKQCDTCDSDQCGTCKYLAAAQLEDERYWLDRMEGERWPLDSRAELQRAERDYLTRR